MLENIEKHKVFIIGILVGIVIGGLSNSLFNLKVNAKVRFVDSIEQSQPGVLINEPIKEIELEEVIVEEPGIKPLVVNGKTNLYCVPIPITSPYRKNKLTLYVRDEQESGGDTYIQYATEADGDIAGSTELETYMKMVECKK